MQDNEQKFETGLAALEMARTAGWKWLESKIQQEIAIELRELREMDVEGKTAEQIASEYLQHRANANAFEKILNMVTIAVKEKDEVAGAISQR
jgi:hypothetical protein